MGNEAAYDDSRHSLRDITGRVKGVKQIEIYVGVEEKDIGR